MTLKFQYERSPLQKIFVHNNKTLYSLAKTFISPTREEIFKRDPLLTQCESIIFGKTKTSWAGKFIHNSRDATTVL